MTNYQGKHVARKRWAAVLLISAAVVVIAAAAAVPVYQRYWNRGPGDPDVSQGEGPAGSGSGPDLSQRTPPENTPPEDQPDGPPEDSAPEDVPYDFTQPVPQGDAVDNSYFDDAAFVGDSRTDGFMLYSGIGTGKNLTSNGLSIFKLAEKKALKIDGKKYTLLEALGLESYGKVYLSLGINELGIHNDEGFYNSYCAAIDAIRAVQPNAVIYIQGLIPLNEKQIEEYNGNKYNLTNEHLRVYNDLMRKVAEEKQVAYLDLYTEFADENGSLPEGVSRDGVHLVKDACIQWLDYLKTHTVEFDRLYPEGLPGTEEPGEAAEPAWPDTSTEDGGAQG